VLGAFCHFALQLVGVIALRIVVPLFGGARRAARYCVAHIYKLHRAPPTVQLFFVRAKNS
jgi:hypothetical protein